MPLPRPRAGSSRDAEMLAVADRLIHDFEDLPVITVFRAIGSARLALREIGQPATAEAVESLARARLVISHSSPATRVAAVA